MPTKSVKLVKCLESTLKNTIAVGSLGRLPRRPVLDLAGEQGYQDGALTATSFAVSLQGHYEVGHVYYDVGKEKYQAGVGEGAPLYHAFPQAHFIDAEAMKIQVVTEDSSSKYVASRRKHIDIFCNLCESGGEKH